MKRWKSPLFSLFLIFSILLSSQLFAAEKVLDYKSWRQGRILFERAKLEQLNLQAANENSKQSLDKQKLSLKRSRGLDVVDYYEIYLSTRFKADKKAIHWALQQLTDRERTQLVIHLQKKLDASNI